MAAEIYIARHGQNQDNAKGVLNGHRDLPLTDLGRAQAVELAEGISDLGLEFTIVYTSPLSRAHETAQIICDRLGISDKLVVMPELIERDFGIMTGHKASEIEELCAPDIIKTNTITYFLNPKNAETFPDLLTRGQNILETIRSKHKSGNILAVCHGDIGKMIYAAASQRSWEEVLKDFHFGNSELIEIESTEAHVIKIKQHNH
ncbi:MAG TPA: histidine phosphatase family protein [Candidatus Saccharibacteria bacterium]|jgi:broad specificity phosphatase PhoE|nr:histidine phosphatase family protein [Candidatus Saccharibacteria bacterium]